MIKMLPAGLVVYPITWVEEGLADAKREKRGKIGRGMPRESRNVCALPGAHKKSPAEVFRRALREKKQLLGASGAGRSPRTGIAAPLAFDFCAFEEAGTTIGTPARSAGLERDASGTTISLYFGCSAARAACTAFSRGGTFLTGTRFFAVVPAAQSAALAAGHKKEPRDDQNQDRQVSHLLTPYIHSFVNCNTISLLHGRDSAGASGVHFFPQRLRCSLDSRP